MTPPISFPTTDHVLLLASRLPPALPFRETVWLLSFHFTPVFPSIRNVLPLFNSAAPVSPRFFFHRFYLLLCRSHSSLRSTDVLSRPRPISITRIRRRNFSRPFNRRIDYRENLLRTGFATHRDWPSEINARNEAIMFASGTNRERFYSAFWIKHTAVSLFFVGENIRASVR